MQRHMLHGMQSTMKVARIQIMEQYFYEHLQFFNFFHMHKLLHGHMVMRKNNAKLLSS